MRQQYSHEVLGFQRAEPASGTHTLRKRHRPISSTCWRDEQQGNRMPAVRLQRCRCTVVSSHCKNRRFKTHQRADRTVECFDVVYFGEKISILTATVRVLIVDEEIVVTAPVHFQSS